MELNEENEKQKSSFLLKLRSILNEPENEEYIKWSKDGKFFILYCKNINTFADNILPQYFKHRNFNSFHRQLNLYNFRTIPNDNQDEIHFIHAKFKKGITDDEIKNIKPIKKKPIKRTKNLKKIKNKNKNKKLNSVQVEENEYENIDNLDEDTKIQKIKENIQKLNNPYKMIFNFLLEKIKSQGFLIEKLKNQYYLFNELSARNTSYEGQNEIINNNNLIQPNFDCFNEENDFGPDFNIQNEMCDPKYQIYTICEGANSSTGNKK